MSAEIVPFPGRRPSEHNSERYLAIDHRSGRGWVVVRTCPCHDGERVTIGAPTRSDARRARRAMLDVAMRFGT